MRLLPIAFTLLLVCGCTNAATTESVPQSPSAVAPITGLRIIDEVVGQGATAKAGQQVTVHYTGYLYDESVTDHRGRKFDSSFDRGTPFAFPLGRGRVIRGWDEGVAGMQVGGKRVLIIPADMAYGASGAGGVIPPNAALLFEVELLDAQPN
ncbi:MAG: FKBP-type peptidyl-prolyl cis-trans isomerase [Xanthomonadaceae bacterium]|jgi:FKBP-type peptidyl-prolyl cis-trans isomerase FkpA|nr:FKBP-type peptidyl-prolyl cis-trans isomerase [Xanthomonadaceae bacterium]